MPTSSHVPWMSTPITWAVRMKQARGSWNRVDRLGYRPSTHLSGGTNEYQRPCEICCEIAALNHLWGACNYWWTFSAVSPAIIVRGTGVWETGSRKTARMGKELQRARRKDDKESSADFGIAYGHRAIGRIHAVKILPFHKSWAMLIST